MKKRLILIFAFLVMSISLVCCAHAEEVIYNLDFEKYDRSIYSVTGWDNVQGFAHTTYPGTGVGGEGTAFTMHTSGYCHGLFTPSEYIDGKGIYRLSFKILRHGKEGTFYIRFGNSDCTAMNSLNNNHMFETLVMNAEKVSYFNGTKGWGIYSGGVEYESDVWYNIDMWLDFDTLSVCYYLDGKLLGKDNINSSFKDIRWIWFRYENTNFENYVSLDDVKLEKIDSMYARKLSTEGVTVPDYIMFPVNISLTSDNSGHIFRKEQIPNFKLTYANQMDGNMNFRADYRVLNRKGDMVFELSKDISLMPGQISDDILEIDVDKFDVYRLYAKYTNLDNGTVLENAVVEFSKVNSPTPGVKNEKYGFGALMGHVTKSRPEYLTPIIDIVGTGMQRDAGFGYTKTENGEYVLSTAQEVYDKIEVFAKESGVKFLVQVGGHVIVPKSTEELEDLEKAMEYFARKYKDSIHYWQYTNELDFYRTDEMSCADYANALRYFYRGVKKGNPDALVLGCTTTRANVEWIKAVLDAGGDKYMDVVTIHPYQGQASPEGARWSEWVMRVKDMLKENGYDHLEVWVTEGNATASKEYNTQLQHGYNLIRHYTTIEMTNCVDRFFHFSLQMEAQDPNNNEHWYGILNGWNAPNSYGAHPEYLMACNYFQQTEGYTYKDCIVKDNQYIARYQNDEGKYLIIMYADYDTKLLSLRLGAKDGILSDVYGNGIGVSGTDGIFTFTLSDAPVFFKYDGTDFEISDGGFKVSDVSRELTRSSTVEYTLYNCAGKTVTAEHSGSLITDIITLGDDVVIKATAVEIPDIYDLDMIFNEYGTKIYRDNINVKISSGSVVEAYLQLGADYVKKSADISLEIKPYNDNTAKYWQITASVKNNNSDESISGIMKFNTPKALSENLEPLMIDNLAPAEERLYTFNVPASDTGTYTTYTGELELSSGEIIDFALGDHPRSFHYKEPAPLNIRYIKKRKSDISIDADISKDEWENYKVYSFGKDNISYGSQGSMIFGVQEEATAGSEDDYKGNSDFSGDMYAQWDDKYLYIAAVINDDYHYAKEAPTRFYLDDLLTVYTQPTRTQRHETRIDMALSEFMNMEPVMFCNWTEIVGQLAVGVIYQTEDGALLDIKRDNGTTVYEARIPAELVSERPFEKYLNIFLNLYVRDYDVETDKNVSWNGWTCLIE